MCAINLSGDAGPQRVFRFGDSHNDRCFRRLNRKTQKRGAFRHYYWETADLMESASLVRPTFSITESLRHY
jgi:hypothetical protein